MNSSETVKSKVMSGWADFGKSPYDWMLIGGTVGLLPLLIVQAGNLWSRQHLQFFPLAWIGFLIVLLNYGRVNTSVSTIRALIAYAAIPTSMLVLGLAVTAFSPWFAQIALIALVSGWAVLRLGSIHWFAIVTWIGLLAVTLPLPMNLDEKLIQSLQIRSSQSASSILDLIGVKHLLLGNVIEVREGKLFVDQACSGVDSLYALIAISLTIIVWQKRSLLVSTIQLIAVPFWAWFGNVLRLLIIAYFYDQHQIDLLHGWQHTMLGLITFSTAFVCMLVNQELINRLLSPLPIGRHNAGWAHKLYNWVVRWPKFSSSESTAEIVQEPVQADKAKRGVLLSGIVVAVGFVLLGAVSFGPIFMVGPWKQVVVAAPNFDRGLIESTFRPESLPANFENMSLRDFKIEQRDRDDLFGEYSATWYFQDKERSVLVSLDFPFPSFHALEVCYQLTGSQVVGSMIDTSYSTPQATKIIRHGEVMDQFNERSFIYYMEFTAGGYFDKATRTLWERLVPTQLREPLFQMQILVKNAGIMSEADHERYRRMIIEAQETLMPLIQGMK